MGVSSTELQFSGNAEKALAEMRKIAEENKRLKDSMEDLAKSSRKASDVATKALDQQTDSTKKLVEENKKLKKQIEDGKKAQDDSLGSLESLKGTLVSLASVQGVKMLVDQFEQLNERVLKSKAASDAMFRQFNVAGGGAGGGATDPRLRNMALNMASRVGVSSADAAATAAELMKAGGLSRQQATGGVLEGALLSEEMLGKSTGKSVVSFLDSAGQDLSRENILGTTRKLLGFQKAGAGLSDADLSEIASQTADLGRLGVNLDDQLAITAALRDKGVSGVGGGLAAVGRHMSKLGSTEGGLAKLQELGLTAADVDLQDKGLETVVRTVMDRIQQVDPANAKARALEMFGKRADIAQSLSQFGGDIDALRKGGLTDEEFRAAANAATRGADKDMLRVQIEDEKQTLAQSAQRAAWALEQQAAHASADQQTGLTWAAAKTGAFLNPLKQYGQSVYQWAGLPALAPMDDDPSAAQARVPRGPQMRDVAGVQPKFRASDKAGSPEDFESLAEQRRDPREAIIDREQAKLEEMDIAQAKARLAANADGRVSRQEKKDLDVGDRAIQELTITLRELRAELKKPVVVPMNPNQDP